MTNTITIVTVTTTNGFDTEYSLETALEMAACGIVQEIVDNRTGETLYSK